MDISRIDALPTKLIDWRRCTAKEIIKYNNDGVEVPPQYLKWAIDFRQDLEKNDKDETTYEMAQKQKVEEKQKEEPTEAQTTNNEKSTESSSADSETDPQGASAQDVNNKTPAEKKREEMENAGASLRSQAKAFTQDSKDATKEVLESAATISDTEDKSTNEIEALESEMTSILARAQSTQEELKSEIQNVNSDKSDKSTFGKINRLNQQLQKYGQDGQTRLASAEGDFNVYETNITEQSSTILNAGDFGSETIGVGRELLNSINGFFMFKIMDFIAGHRAEKAGERAVNFALATSETQTEANQVNNDNKSRISELKTEVNDVTGVEGYSTADKDQNEAEEKEKVEEQTSAQTDSQRLASGDLEKILMAKLRRGQDIEA